MTNSESGGRAAWRDRLPYLEAIAAVAALSGAMTIVRDQLGILNVLLLYLLLLFALALTLGAGPAGVAAVASFVAFDYLFIPPYHTLTIADPSHVLVLLVYLGVAIFTAEIVARVRTRTDEAERERRRATLLYELNAALIGGATLDAILARIAERVVAVFGAAGCRLLLPDEAGAVTVRARFPASMPADLDDATRAGAAWLLAARAGSPDGGAGSGWTPPPAPAPFRADVLMAPIATAERVVGVLEVTRQASDDPFDPDDKRILTTFADQAALALERARLTEEAAQVAILARSDELKSALLAAVSHDLRTPLASIKASATALLDASVDWDDAARRDFLQAIDEETDRLTLVVSNLLDLSRIEGGALKPVKAWYDAAELIDDVVDRLANRLAQHELTVDIAGDLPLVNFDYVEISQVLVNLIENAVKYTPPGTKIDVSVRQVPGAIEFAVSDEGPGIAEAQLPRIFDHFVRAAPSEIRGSGIGLAICKGLVQAHGGQIGVVSDRGRGARFWFTLPLDEAATEPAQAEEQRLG
ncbi:MAG TPA: ATP-binding protein [Thermomicrobiales bacterium]|nr:ATP-binding protein [Thermomicrobiales bacterium]